MRRIEVSRSKDPLNKSFDELKDPAGPLYGDYGYDSKGELAMLKKHLAE